MREQTCALAPDNMKHEEMTNKPLDKNCIEIFWQKPTCAQPRDARHVT